MKGTLWIKPKRKRTRLFKGLLLCILLLFFVVPYVRIASEKKTLETKLSQLTAELAFLKTENKKLFEENKRLSQKIAMLEGEKRELLVKNIKQLKDRYELLERLLRELGVKETLKKAQSSKTKGVSPEGGIFVPLSEKPDYRYLLELSERLVEAVDAHLEVITKVPVGRPAPGYISSRFGRRRDPFSGKPAFHTGVDIAAYAGTPVKSTADGKVIYAGRHPGYGNVVVIEHGFGYSTLYGHLKRLKVVAGQRVKRGDTIGYIGNTGRTAGTHLHYEVRRYGRYLTPLKFIKFKTRP